MISWKKVYCVKAIKQEIEKIGKNVSLKFLANTLSPGTELKSPERRTEDLLSNLSDTRVLNLESRDSRYLTCASFTSAHSGFLQHKEFLTTRLMSGIVFSFTKLYFQK